MALMILSFGITLVKSGFIAEKVDQARTLLLPMVLDGSAFPD